MYVAGLFENDGDICQQSAQKTDNCNKSTGIALNSQSWLIPLIPHFAFLICLLGIIRKSISEVYGSPSGTMQRCLGPLSLNPGGLRPTLELIITLAHKGVHTNWETLAPKQILGICFAKCKKKTFILWAGNEHLQICKYVPTTRYACSLSNYWSNIELNRWCQIQVSYKANQNETIKLASSSHLTELTRVTFC